jgi:hypothetical protein
MFEPWSAPFLSLSRILWKTPLRFQRVNLL